MLAGTVVVGASAGCTPIDEFTIDNRSSEPVVVWGETVQAGDKVRFEHSDGCVEVDVVTENLLLRLPVRRLCDGDTLIVRDETLVPLVEYATVRNETGVAVDVRFDGTLFEARLDPGEDARIVLPPSRGRCSQALLTATFADVTDAAVVRRPGSLCVGDEWLLTEAAMTAESAAITVVNGTDLAWRLEVTVPWGDRVLDPVTVRAGETVELAIGIPRDACDEEIHVDAYTAGDGAQVRMRVRGPWPLCDGDTWEIDPAEIETRDGSEWSWGRPFAFYVTNATADDVRVRVDDADPVVIAPGERVAIDHFGSGDGCSSVRMTADVTGAVRPQFATGLVDVCNGAEGVVTLEGIEILAPEAPSATP